ncbi:MAG: hypothetical protein DHS20C16_36220 [Phycisphaerae bacterium]|nr:MAG: hypothetical protein DHS20C16_36220 [Phycisphaerae bacterium]
MMRLPGLGQVFGCIPHSYRKKGLTAAAGVAAYDAFSDTDTVS